MNIFKTFLLLLAVFITMPLMSANLYIQYDPQCMDRLEYSHMESDQTASYVVYQVQVNEHEKLVLEVGLEVQQYQTYLPSQSINCSNAIYSREMVSNINTQKDQAFIVYQKGRKQYYVSPVSFAAYYVKNDDKISYSAPQYQFELNLRRGIIGENIASNRQRSEVYFDGRLENQCSGAYVFRQFSLYTSSPHMDIIIVPEVGIVEMRNGRNAEDALQNIRRLEKVNDQYLSDYMDMVCLGIMPETKPRSGNTTIYQPQPDAQSAPVKPDLQAKSGVVIPRKHKVQKKETLFRIAKQNNVSLADLRKWNKLENSNTIFPGDELWLGPPVDETQFQAKGGDVSADGLPAPYDVPGTEKFAWGEQEDPLTERGTNYWEDHPSEYFVEPGETVASIARKFGFTESRFRKMNNLQPMDEVKIGQMLITTDCEAGFAPRGYDLSANSTEDADTPPYESKITPTTDYYYNQRLRQQQTPRSVSTSNAGTSSFEPYNSNTPKFYESPEANRIRTTTQTSGGTFRYDNRPQTQARSLQGNDSPASYNYDMSTLPQGYDSTDQGRGAVSKRDNRTLHFVKEGETLFDIAKKYGVSVERLRELNQIGIGETIMPFQHIYVN